MDPLTPLTFEQSALPLQTEQVIGQVTEQVTAQVTA